jgi:exopolyphosphatase/guanosine-5'-triphosphate,3'-diphosphate pyrophosphatase
MAAWSEPGSSGGTTGPEIVPRWEWRTFGERFGDADDVLGTIEPSSVHDSEEVYLLSATSEASVKIRDGLMDIKQRLEVNDDGLELWRPVMKADFPLSWDEVESVLAALNVAVPDRRRESYTLDEFVGEVVRPHPDLRAVDVRKRRARYVVDECMVEMTEIRTDGASTHTLAVEAVDPSIVSSTIARLGLDGFTNVSVPRGLKALVGFGTRRYAVIDVGTNSVKFHLGERRADGALATIVDRADITRLGEGQSESGMLADHAIARTVDAVAVIVDEARRNGAREILAVGTAGLRRAPNRAALVDAVQDRCGITVEVISGEEEARLAYLAATSALPSRPGPRVVFDSGGGSTQFTFGHDGQVDERFSIDVGAVRVAERFGLAGAITLDTLGEVLAAVAADLERLAARPRPDGIVAIGGTATNLAAVKHGLEHYDPEVVQGTVLDLGEIDRQIHLYRTRTADERRQIAGLQPARADVILGGACIVRTILTRLDHDRLTVSDHGLRHGLVLEHFAR